MGPLNAAGMAGGVLEEDPDGVREGIDVVPQILELQYVEGLGLARGEVQRLPHPIEALESHEGRQKAVAAAI